MTPNMSIPFVKMHGIGNDYVYLDAVTEPALAERDDLPSLARAMSDRHTGIGSDGLILVCPPSSETVDADVRMRMFNADGSESEMCGNGVRCVAKFAHDRLGVRANPMRIETGMGAGAGTGVLPIEYEAADGSLVMATVDMGEPTVELSDIPVVADCLGLSGGRSGFGDHGAAPLDVRDFGSQRKKYEYDIVTDADTHTASFVSMGNPHAVIFVENAALVDLARIGPLLETHAAFPRRMNVHFVEVVSPGEAIMRTWERGSGITRACGTGACAVCVAGVRTGRLSRDVLLHLPGGDLSIRWDERTNHVFMTGPAEESFTGTWPMS